MSRDRSLDEFLGGERRDSVDESAEADVTDDLADATETEPEAEPSPGSEPAADGDEATVTPAVSTYAFSPDGAPCGACGTVVEKRWRDDGDLVCPDCKQW